MKLVRFKDGTYGIKKSSKFLWWEDVKFLSNSGSGNFFTDESNIYRFCRFYSIEGAMSVLKQYEKKDISHVEVNDKELKLRGLKD